MSSGLLSGLLVAGKQETIPLKVSVVAILTTEHAHAVHECRRTGERGLPRETIAWMLNL